MLCGFGRIAARSSAPGEAEAAFRRSLDLARELEMRPVAAQCHVGLAAVLRDADRPAEGREHLDQALALIRAMGTRALATHAEEERARFG